MSTHLSMLYSILLMNALASNKGRSPRFSCGLPATVSKVANSCVSNSVVAFFPRADVLQ